MKTLNYLKESICILFIILCFASCSYNGRYTTNLPVYLRKADCESVVGKSTLSRAASSLRRPGQLWVTGDSLAIIDVNKGDVYSLISISGDSLISRFGKRGNGPGELLRPSLMQFDDNKQVYIYDDGKQLMHAGSIEHLTTDMDASTPLHFKDMSGGFLCRTLNGYVGDNLYGDGHIFSYYDNTGNYKMSFGAIPDTELLKEANPDFYMANQVCFVVSPDKKYLCAMGIYHDWLAFFDVSGNSPKLIKEYFSVHPIVETSGGNDKYHLSTTENTVMHYWAAAPYENGLFINYIGSSQKDLDNGNFQNCLLKCNWKGEIEKCYKVSEQIGSIASNSDGSCVYGVVLDPMEDNKVFFKYTNL